MTSTPPPSTLSTPSPTERSSWTQDQQPQDSLPSESEIPSASKLQEMNLIKTAKPIHLIVATSLSPHLGIGNKGTLPWPSIKADMAFFRKATTGRPTKPQPGGEKLNAVIMGRKTYESVPARFRPLANRVNVVLTRSGVREFADKVLRDLTGGDGGDEKEDSGREPAEYRLVDQAMFSGKDRHVVSIVKRDHEQPMVVVTDSVDQAVDVDARDLFCIGGSEIYKTFLEDKALKGRLRVLQTWVKRLDGGEFECDAFWPVDMSKESWEEVDAGTVEEWVGVKVPQGEEEWLTDEKAGVQIRTTGWKKEHI